MKILPKMKCTNFRVQLSLKNSSSVKMEAFLPMDKQEVVKRILCLAIVQTQPNRV